MRKFTYSDPTVAQRQLMKISKSKTEDSLLTCVTLPTEETEQLRWEGVAQADPSQPPSFSQHEYQSTLMLQIKHSLQVLFSVGDSRWSLLEFPLPLLVFRYLCSVQKTTLNSLLLQYPKIAHAFLTCHPKHLSSFCTVRFHIQMSTLQYHSPTLRKAWRKTLQFARIKLSASSSMCQLLSSKNMTYWLWNVKETFHCHLHMLFSPHSSPALLYSHR